MREHRRIVSQWKAGSASILATLVRLQGSGYRQPGARLLLCKDGTYEGSISAGCLEGDLLRRAAWLTREGAVVECYSTVFDEMTEMPFGLGCGGVIDILLEPAETPACNALLQSVESGLAGQERFVATWLPSPGTPLMRAVLSADGEVIFASEMLTSDALLQARMECLGHGSGTSDAWFTERIVPPQRLFVFGAGDDAKPLVSMAALLGWTVTVLDGRSHLVRKDRFPEAADVEVLNGANCSVFQQIRSNDAAVLMTHSYEQDRDYLAALLPMQPKFLGVLGSRKRSSLLIAEAAARLDWPVSECCELVSAPIGLDIGGEGPEAIALAVMAEIQAICMGKPIGSRRLSAEIVQRVCATEDTSGLQHNHCSPNAL